MTEIIRNGNVITIVCGSRIDTINAGAFENDITPLLAEKDTQLIFDCNALDYISSSGLRVVLKAQKIVSARKGEMKLIAVKPQIKKVFDMTGFSRFLTIK